MAVFSQRRCRVDEDRQLGIHFRAVRILLSVPSRRPIFSPTFASAGRLAAAVEYALPYNWSIRRRISLCARFRATRRSRPALIRLAMGATNVTAGKITNNIVRVWLGLPVRRVGQGCSGRDKITTHERATRQSYGRAPRHASGAFSRPPCGGDTSAPIPKFLSVLRHPLMRTPECQRHWRFYNSSAVFEFEALTRACEPNDRKLKFAALAAPSCHPFPSPLSISLPVGHR